MGTSYPYQSLNLLGCRPKARHWTLNPGIGVRSPAPQIFKDEILMCNDKKFQISLTKKDIDRIFKWYDKGFTNIYEDKPLFDKLKKLITEGIVADTISCYLKDEKCENCNKNPVEFIHRSDLTNDKLVKLCSSCFKNLTRSEQKE